MKEVVVKLIENGIDFEYLFLKDGGEKITCELVEITRQKGKIYFENNGDVSNFQDTAQGMFGILSLLEKIIIEFTN